MTSTTKGYNKQICSVCAFNVVLLHALCITITSRDCQSPRRSSTSCACWFASRFWDTRRNTSRTFWHRLPLFEVDLHYAPHYVATSLCRRHVDELATEPFLLLHREHGTVCRQSWKCGDGRARFVVIWKHFCFILSTGTRIRIDFVIRQGLLVRGTIQMHQLQLQLHRYTRFCRIYHP